MREPEIIDRAMDKLPNVEDWEHSIIAIPVLNTLELGITDSCLPMQRSNGFEVFFKKSISDINDKVTWEYYSYHEL